MAIPLENITCYDVIGDVNTAAQEVLSADQQYYVLGGIATAAIRHPGEPVVRENGTQRDIDLLVLDVLTADQAEKVNQKVSEAIGKQLVVSVFGLTRYREATILSRTGRSFAAWTSKRTLSDDGTLRYELHPLRQEISRESFSPWTLQLPNGDEVAVLNPAAHMLAYFMRSISGLRVKDAKKVEEMKARIFADPKFQEQINDGLLKPWQQFANDINILGNLVSAPTTLSAGQTASVIELFAFRKKSEWLRFFEANPRIVKYAQKGLLQAILRPIIGSH